MNQALQNKYNLKEKPLRPADQLPITYPARIPGRWEMKVKKLRIRWARHLCSFKVISVCFLFFIIMQFIHFIIINIILHLFYVYHYS